MEKIAETQKLITPFEKSSESSWETEYPRPQMKRESFLSLCGTWNLIVKRQGKSEKLGEIKVPYPPESRISGIERALGDDEKYIYEKNFVLDEKMTAGRVIIHFGAVDQIARVFINGNFAGENKGGYIPFCYDITEYIQKGENTARVEVVDKTDIRLPYGKQCKKRGGMWYTPISGIWQSVWIEAVPENYIRTLKITPTLKTVTIETEGGEAEKTILLGEKEYVYTGDRITIDVENGVYDFEIISGKDRIKSYFALRTIDIENGYIRLNKEPYFFHGVLDQGYYGDGIYTPASPEGYEYDILTMKRLGFNMLRKHIKIEPDVFYYYCDKYGMVVFQDAVNNGKYSFIRDTALPTVGLRMHREPALSMVQKNAFEKTLNDMVKHLYNHPSVCYWTIFNEGWGQFDTDGIYDRMKKKDPTRVWDATSGWFKKKKSDVDSEHVYFRKIKLRQKGERPLVLSEFGGFSCAVTNHVFNTGKAYGYSKNKTKEEFLTALETVYLDEIVPCIKEGLCASVMTQLSDVEDEINGIVTYDRQIVKVNGEEMLNIRKMLDKVFEDTIRGNEDEG